MLLLAGLGVSPCNWRSEESARGWHRLGNQMFLRELGVEEPIDYESARFDEVVHDVDVVWDTIGGDT
jgi:hypothetical protein